ncbi:hypothetical protein [Marinicellulosiphila megalodicopiae]|uniref:hypothetical protein n=1 Tax=Marinicellulosiphila megalodicopiae TaxID=2724896 RepID=UPI003BB1F5EF
MGINERENILAVINFFWGNGMTTSSAINDNVALVVYKALKEAGICSDSMDLVPRPASGIPSTKWVVKQVAKAGKRVLDGDPSVYNSCKNQVAALYGTELRMALSGL